MTSLDGDMAGVANTQTEELVRLKEEETCLSDQEGKQLLISRQGSLHYIVLHLQIAHRQQIRRRLIG